ncbi:hypothetical protein AAL_05463 [Moelleriella libera RCEF 2490]|uniref:DUF3752 domain-containing protein n=1 Tax=Moelleriella libera RCEF 2490 TaxID=1081109 RepID=A0A168AC89_9HYPO|nr:hypothetical protein AAL_05463 [Moelleriella libera RCEF 2490]
MSSIGPQLPPEPTKRKRSPHEDEHDSAAPAKQARHQGANGDEIDLDSDADSDIGHFAPAATVIGPSMPSSTQADNGSTTGKPSKSRHPRTAIGPSMPPASENSNEIQLDSESDSETGPPAPPSSTSKHPTSGAAPESHTDAQPASSSSSDDDDDAYGPSLPNPAAARRPLGPSLPAPETAPQRDSWMLAPPPSSSYSERDPTRMRARKFSSKPASSKPSASEASIWTETPEEKLARQKDALLGRSTTTSAREAGGSTASSSSSLRDKQKEERDRRIAESIDAARGKSLLDEHKQRRDHHEANTTTANTTTKKQEDEEDDPSKRAFDREKDMAIGGKIGARARQELISKSANFGGRFQKGSFL